MVYPFSSAGDVNNDGYDDIIIGAPGEIPNSAVYIYSVYDQKYLDTLYSLSPATDTPNSLPFIGE